MARIFAFIEHKAGILEDSADELAAAIQVLDPSATSVAIVTGDGSELEAAANTLRSIYAEVWTLAKPELSHPNAELLRQALVQVIPPKSIVLVPHDHFGIDLAPGLAIKMDAAFVSDVVSVESSEPPSLRLVRQEFGGQVSTHVRCDISSGAVLSIRPGAIKAQNAKNQNGAVIDKSPAVGALIAKRRYLETIVPEEGAVDITKHSVLVSIGRGIQEKDNVALAHDLADAMGAAVSCSRPVVDAKWLEKSRQVGSSGKTVKPKVYLACGISGAFQHLAGLKGNPFIIAINKNPKAPIFQVADVGIVDDLLEFLPELTNKIREMHSAPVK